MDVDWSPREVPILPSRGNEFCKADPTPVHSPGLWDPTNAKNFINYALPRLQLQLVVMFFLTQSLYTLLKRFHLSRIVSEILAGIILGPTILGAIIPNFTEALFPQEGDIYLQLLSKIGFVFFMFLIGVKMDTSLVVKSGRRAWTIGLLSVVIPIVVAIMVSSFMDAIVDINKVAAIKIVIGVQTFSPFPVISCLLTDLKITNTELGRLTLACSLIKDLSNTLLETIINFERVGNVGSKVTGMQVLVIFAVFVLTMVFGGRAVFSWIIRQTPEGKPVNGVYIVFISFSVLLSSIISDNLGTQYQLGPFILGLTVPGGPPLGATLVDTLDTFISGLFTPLLLTYCGLRSNLLVVYDLSFISLVWIAVFVGAVVKVASTFSLAVFCKIPAKDATSLALILSAQGVVELAMLLSYRQNMTLDEETFSSGTLSVLLIAVVIPLLVRSIYDSSRIYAGYQKRNLLHSTESGELRILVCAHRQDDAWAAIKLLESSNATKESPLAVYALHLMELVGRASPLIINHKFGQKTSTAGARSQNVIDIFKYYENQYSGLVDVQAFTAISMPKFMHQDICSLAFDRMASLIILPFHKKWNYQGKVILDSNIWRTINNNVLEMAPCSVGILLDRRKIQKSSVSVFSSGYRVAVIFLGGDDDREALAFAKRMANSSEVQLTVLHLVAFDVTADDNWETMLDAEILKDIKFESSIKSNMIYLEKKSKDGPDTALIVRSMEDAFDLILVGRRHRSDSPLLSGLAEWIELAELGAIGDLLASTDDSKPVSVLVVQQQFMQIK